MAAITVYLKSGSGVAEFVASHAYSVGDRIVPKRTDTAGWSGNAKLWVWECTTAGTSAASNPTWPAPPLTQDVTTVTSGNAVFTARRPGFSSGSTPNWTFATIYMDYIARADANGDNYTIYVSANHAEDIGANVTYDWIGANNDAWTVLCVNDAAAPPTALATGAVCAANSIFLDHFAYIYGITFRSDIGAFNTVTGTHVIFEQCMFHVNHTGASTTFNADASGGFVIIELIDCTLRFGAAGQGIALGNAPSTFTMRGGGLHVSSAAITSLIKGVGVGAPANILLDGVDLSGAATAFNFTSDGAYAFRAVGCKMPASWSGSVTSAAGAMMSDHESYGNDSGAAIYRRERKSSFGRLQDETTIVRTGGASDGTTSLAWKLTATNDCGFPYEVFASPWIDIWNAGTGSATTVAIELLHDGLTALNDDEVWIEVMYQGTSGSTRRSLARSRRGLLASPAAVASSSSAWTTTGLTNPNKQKVSVSITPQVVGYISARVVLAKASKVLYVDPLLILS